MIDTGLFPDLIKKGLDEVIDGARTAQLNPGPGYATAMNPLIFKPKTTDSAFYNAVEEGGVGYFTVRQEHEDIRRTTLEQGPLYTRRVQRFEKNLPISYEMMADELYGAIKDKVVDLGRKAVQTQNKAGFGFLQEGLPSAHASSNGTTLTADGTTLFSTAHADFNGTAIANYFTGVLNEANLEASIANAENMTSLDGTIGGNRVVAIVTSVAQFADLARLMKSDVVVDGTNGTMNFVSEYYGNVQIFKSPFLTGTAWYVITDAAHLARIEREAFNTHLIDWTLSDNDEYIYKARYRELYVAPSWQGILAYSGA